MFHYDEDKMLAHINEKWVNKVCPYCGHDEWNFDSKIYTPIELHDGFVVKNQGQGHFLPLVTVTCLNCGNTAFINAVAAGCMEPGDKEAYMHD